MCLEHFAPEQHWQGWCILHGYADQSSKWYLRQRLNKRKRNTFLTQPLFLKYRFTCSSFLISKFWFIMKNSSEVKKVKHSGCGWSCNLTFYQMKNELQQMDLWSNELPYFSLSLSLHRKSRRFNTGFLPRAAKNKSLIISDLLTDDRIIFYVKCLHHFNLCYHVLERRFDISNKLCLKFSKSTDQLHFPGELWHHFLQVHCNIYLRVQFMFKTKTHWNPILLIDK